MTRHYAKEYYQRILEIQQKVIDAELETIEQVGQVFSKTIQKGNNVFVFGASHAGIIAEEMFYRTGGLALINPMFNPTLMLNTRPVSLTSQMERLDGFGKNIFNGYPVKEGDTLLIHSVSGRNTVTIDMAEEAKKRGVTVVVITNMVYTKGVTSRHPSGKNLYEFADYLIDNHGNFEDSAIALTDMNQKSGATSSVIGCMIANMILLATIQDLQASNIEPPVFRSANVDGGDAFNAKIFSQYKEQIHYM